MKFIKASAVAVAMLTVLPGTAFAAYDGWIAGGTGIYGATAATAEDAKAQATMRCTEAEGVACSGAFALDPGSMVVSAHCVSGDTSGYVVGQSRKSVEDMITQSSFQMSECVVTE